MNHRQKREVLLEHFTQPYNWQPNCSKIARDTGLAVTTVWDHYKRSMAEGRLEVYIKELSNIELRKKRQTEEETQDGNQH